MKSSLKFYKKAGILLTILGIILIGYYQKSISATDYEVVVRCLGALIFIIGGTTLIYVNEKENQKPDKTY